ncbi:MAG: hypothetical protein IJH45_05360 [Firmicutes bacterium]|nr:hypothetical protein [Bacillota bacterium]
MKKGFKKKFGAFILTCGAGVFFRRSVFVARALSEYSLTRQPEANLKAIKVFKIFSGKTDENRAGDRRKRA